MRVPDPPGASSGFSVGLAGDGRDFAGILALQRASREPTADGFVTVEHTPEILAAMHAIAPSVVARDGDGAIVGYALVMPRATQDLLPILDPMFEQIGRVAAATLSTKANPRWYVMGQIAVAPAWRGRGVFDALYAGHHRFYADRFDLAITEVAVRNPRSLRAHQRVGFRTLARYRDATDEWVLLALDLDARLGRERKRSATHCEPARSA